MDRSASTTARSTSSVTPEGRHVFLEVNPSGEFFWLERNPGLPISEALAEVLLGKAPRRGSWSAFLHAPVTQHR